MSRGGGYIRGERVGVPTRPGARRMAGCLPPTDTDATKTRTVGKRAVRILLECFLVRDIIQKWFC